MKIAWCFPGQGSQFVGMGKELFESSRAAREVFEAADSALGRSISRLCFEGPEDDLTLTRNTQPALVSTSVAILAAMRERLDIPLPSYAAGHSLGEYSALVAASALTLADAVRIVEARGTAMQAAVPAGEGAMAAIIGVAKAKLEELCAEARQGEVVSPANFNAPGQIVVAGDRDAVARVCRLATENQGKAIPLKVSAPFHCSLMESAAREVLRCLATIEVRPPTFPVIANVDATPNRDAIRIKDLLVRQVDHPVLWEQTIVRMFDDGVTHLLEIGPGKVLAGLAKRTAKAIQVISISDSAGIDAVEALLRDAVPALS